MKRSAAVVLTLLLTCIIVFTPVIAFANSAQRHFYGVTSGGAIVNEKDCPVTVTAERLTFDIPSYPLLDELTDYNSAVTAEYDFYNPADYDVNMQLVFPFGLIPDYVYDEDFNDTSKYSIYVNGAETERSIRAVYTNSFPQFDIFDELPKISDEPVLYKGLPDDTVVYKYTVKSTFEQYADGNAVEYAADFDYSGKQLFIAVQDNNNGGYHCSNGKLRMYGDVVFTLYSINRTLDDKFFSADYFVILRDGKNGNAEKNVSGSTSFKLETLSLGGFLSINYNEEKSVSALDYRNAAVTYLTENADRSGVYNINYNIYENLIYWYQYDVCVPSGQTVTNKVVAPLYPDIDGYYNPPKYSYNYLLSPASGWADFSNLDITVNTQYFMSNESLSGFKKTDGGYFAHFDKLPQGELTFDLCKTENPEYNGRENGAYSALIILMLLFFPLLFLGVGYSVLVLISVLYAIWVLAAAVSVPIVMCRDRRKMRLRQQQSALHDKPPLDNDGNEKINDYDKGI